MNRLRGLDGPNSYTRELGFYPLDRLTAVAATAPDVAWLDLCCGSGRALVEAAEQLQRAGLAGRAHLVGVDLVDFFATHPPEPAGLSLVCAPVATWCPTGTSTSSPACTVSTTWATSSAYWPGPPVG